MRRWVLVGGLALVAATCGDGGAGSTTTESTTTSVPVALLAVVEQTGLAYTPELELDVYRPDAAGPWPVVVLVPGGGWDSAELTSTAPLAEHTAGRGAVVFNATYRLTAPGAFGDVACAVRYATENAALYGGDASRLVLAGHSAGGHVSAVVALSGEDFGGECTATVPYAAPTGWVGISGAYNIEALQFVPDLRRFFGGTIGEVPEAWERGNPFTYLDRRPDLNIGLVHGRSDVVIFPFSTVDFADALARSGRAVEPTYISAADHFDVTDPATAGARTAGVIIELAG